MANSNISRHYYDGNLNEPLEKAINAVHRAMRAIDNSLEIKRSIKARTKELEKRCDKLQTEIVAIYSSCPTDP